MKKFKYLLILSLIVFAVGCIVTGCEITGQVDSVKTPILVTYCANGGTLGGKAEKYLYIEKGVPVPEPGKSSTIAEAPIRNGYKFVGWVEGKVDESKVFEDPSGENKLGEHYAPKLKGESEVELVSKSNSDGTGTVYSLAYDIESEYGAQDGGVFMTVDGAVTSQEVIDTLLNDTISSERKEAIRLKLYDYERRTADGTVPKYDFRKRIEGENYKTEIVLIAVWANYSQFLVADKNEDGSWEGTEAYEALVASMENDPNWIEGNDYLSLKNTGRLFDVKEGDGSQITGAQIRTAYNATRNPEYRKAEVDLEEKEELWLQVKDSNPDKNSEEYREYLNIKSAYDEALTKFNEEKKNIKHTPIRFFDSQDLTSYGESDLTDVSVNGNIGIYEVGTSLFTVLYYTEYDGDIDVAFKYDDFKDALNGDKDIYIEEDIIAANQKSEFVNKTIRNKKIFGNNHTIKLSSDVEQEDRSNGAPNIYGAFIGAMEKVEISDLTIELDVNFTIRISPYKLDEMGNLIFTDRFEDGYVRDEDGNRIPVPGNDKCYVGCLTGKMSGCRLSNVDLKVTYKLSRSEVTYRYKDPPDAEEFVWKDVTRVNDFEVEVFFTKLQAQGEDGDGENTVTDCTYSATEVTEGESQGEENPANN